MRVCVFVCVCVCVCLCACALRLQSEARETIAAVLGELDLGRTEKCVRVNSVSSGLAEEDLRVILGAEALPTALMLPKVEGVEEVQWVSPPPPPPPPPPSSQTVL